ncbi:iron ABC transporter permease [Streptococcus gallolyticus]|nr:iron ABC transporter permease [Streptococcus gallolyticus]MBY5040514.1 iron ABC transporter permease [Streptococcus gallolyticus]
MIKGKKLFVYFSLAILLTFFCFILSLSLGYSKLDLLDVLKVLTGQAPSGTVLIIRNIRLPRILVCLFAGASLAISGQLLQTLTRNPLADSGILGINTGAGMVVALMISYTDLLKLSFLNFMPFLATLGGIATILFVYLISFKKGQGTRPNRLIVAGIGVSTMLSSTMVAIVGNLDRYKVDYIASWLSGRITGDNWQTIWVISPFFFVLWLLVYLHSNQLNILNLNEQTALGLGIALQKERILILLLSTGLAALSVLLVGNVTFVGLVAGHITRKLVGSNHRISLPFAMLVGMMLLLIADTIGRVLLVGTGIPTGIVVSIIGAPYFLYLMRQTK